MKHEEKDLLKQYLQRYYRAKKIEKQLEIRLNTFRSDMSGMQGVRYTGMPGGSGISQGAAAVVIRINEVEERIQRQRTELTNIMLEVMNVIEFLRLDSMERAIVEYRHIDCLSWKEICEIMHLSRNPCTRYYNIGLDKLMGYPKVSSIIEEYKQYLHDSNIA